MKRRHKLDGFILPIVLVLVFAIMAVTAALIGTVTTLDRMSRAKNRRLVETISLESTVTKASSDLANGAPATMAPFRTADQSINGYKIETEGLAPESKLDLNMDRVDALMDGFASAKLADGLAARAASAIASNDNGEQHRFVNFADFAARAKLSSREEDCLRRLATVGRWPGSRAADVGRGPAGDANQELTTAAVQRVLTPGQQIELRARLIGKDADERLLWARLRLTGRSDQPVLQHEWRFLTLAPAPRSTCGLVPPSRSS